MSGTVPGAPWGAAISIRAKYLLKSRERMLWTTTVHRRGGHGEHLRRCRRWTPWITVAWFTDAAAAFNELETRKRRAGLTHLQVFYRGKPYRISMGNPPQSPHHGTESGSSSPR